MARNNLDIYEKYTINSWHSSMYSEIFEVFSLVRFNLREILVF